MEIVLVSPELPPFSRVSVLGDAVAGLAKALRGLGHRVLVVTPFYEGIDVAAHSLARRLSPLSLDIAGSTHRLVIHDARTAAGVDVALIGGPPITRAAPYGPAGGDEYEDNPLRFCVFGAAALEVARVVGRKVQIVHAHGWAASLALHFLRAGGDSGMLDGAQGILTVHHVERQGVFEKAWVERLGLGWEGFHPDGFEWYGKLSFMKAGIAAAARVTTVSPWYAKEIQRDGMGAGLEGRLRVLEHPLVGISYGIDPAIWNPATDPVLATRYDAEEPSGKALCKTALQSELGLSTDADAPVVGVVSRLVREKGMDLLAAVVPAVLRLGAQVVVVGCGDSEIEAALRGLAEKNPGRVAYRADTDDALTHRVYAGSDFCAVPSRHQPCGQSQLCAMRYGAIPVVRKTGGLADTVVDADAGLATGTGFVFVPPEADALLGALQRAVSAYRDRPGFVALRRRAMRAELTWERSARLHEQLYRQALA